MRLLTGGTVVGLAACLACSSPEPTYEGRERPFWVFSLSSAHAGERIKACEAIASMGKSAGPEAAAKLLKLLGDSDEDVQLAAVAAVGKMDAAVIPLLEDQLSQSENDLLKRLRTAHAILLVAPGHVAATKAVVTAFSGLGNATLAERARQAVIGIGAQMVPHITALLDDPYVPVRVLAIETLGSIGEAARSSNPKLVAQLESDRPTIRVAALKSLARIGPKEEVVVPVRAAAADKDPSVAVVAQDLLTYLEPPKP